MVHSAHHSLNATKGDPPPKSIRILLVDDHALIREALASLLELDPHMHIVGEAGTGTEALEHIETQQPSVVLLDLSLPGLHGIEVIRQTRARHPDIKCLVLTVHASEQIIRAAIHAGAAGYLLKEASYAELIAAIHAVAKGQRYLSPMIADKVLSDSHESSSMWGSGMSLWHGLSPREREVLKMVAEGASSKAIASNLCISVRTVEKHRLSLMNKLKLRTTAALTAYAIQHELVDSTRVLKSD